MELHLRAVGCLLVVLALIHGIFPIYFKWRSEFAALSLINRQMMYVHTFFISLVILLMGLLCITSSKELLGTELGGRVALGFGVFWILRLLIQFFGYSTKLWKGKKIETAIHISFSILWAYVSTVFLIVFWMAYRA